MTDKELRRIARRWLSPLDEQIADLIDKSDRMTIGAFIREVERAIDQVPLLYDKLDREFLNESLENAMADSVIGALEARA
jgi:hypothetical protein